jgi:ATP-binding cassette subfamily F protein uup
VVTGLLVFEGDGVVGEFVGGYNDYIRYRRQRDAQRRDLQAAAPAASPRATPKARKLSYKDQRELTLLPERLQGLEAEKERIEAELADGAIYRGSQQALTVQLARLAAIALELEGGYARWSELESLAAGG